MSYVYSGGTAVRRGDFVTVTTGSAKNGTLARRNGFVAGFGARELTPSHDVLQVTVAFPDGGTATEAPSRLALISR